MTILLTLSATLNVILGHELIT